MFSFRSLKFNELLRSLPAGECTARWGGLGLWCMHRSASLSLGFTASLARPLAHLPALAGGHAGLDASILCRGTIRLFVFGEIFPPTKIHTNQLVSNQQKI